MKWTDNSISFDSSLEGSLNSHSASRQLESLVGWGGVRQGGPLSVPVLRPCSLVSHENSELLKF